MTGIRWIWAQLVKEAREFRRSLFGLITVLSWTGVLIVVTVVYFLSGRRFLSTADAVYSYWSLLLFLAFPVYLYPAMVISGEAESGRWDFLRGVRVPWWKMLLGKFSFAIVLTGGLVLTTVLVFVVALGFSGFVVSATAFSRDWPIVLLTSAGLVWLVLLPATSQAFFFSSVLPNRGSALILSLSFFFIATFAAGNIFSGLANQAGLPGVVAVPYWSFPVILLSPSSLTGILANEFGLVRHVVSTTQNGAVFQQTVGYPVLGSFIDYVAWILGETAVFFTASVVVLAFRERK
jgi:hypothetical protein